MSHMTLEDWIQRNNINPNQLAAQLNVSTVSVWRFRKHYRTPNKSVMNKIKETTNGQVTANDFYHNN